MSFPSYSDDPAAFLRKALNHHTDPLETQGDSDEARLKRKIAILQRELAAWRRMFPDYVYRPKIDGFTYNGVEVFEG